MQTEKIRNQRSWYHVTQTKSLPTYILSAPALIRTITAQERILMRKLKDLKKRNSILMLLLNRCKVLQALFFAGCVRVPEA